MQLSRSIVRVTATISIVALATAGFVTYRAAQDLSRASEALVHTKDVTLALERALSMLRDAETGQRGYLLTGRPEYLEPYMSGLTQIRDHLDKLVGLMGNNSDAEQSLTRLSELVRLRIELLHEGVAVTQTGEPDPAREARMLEGKSRMDLVRGVIAEMQLEQDERLSRQLVAFNVARTATIRTAIVTTLVAISVLGVLLYIVRRDSARVRVSEERLATTLRSIGEGVIATNANGVVMVMNPVAEALTGWRASDAVRSHMDEVFRVVNEETRATVESPVSRVLREGGIVGLANHTLLIRRDGIETPIEDSAAPIVDHHGEVIGVVLVFRDATETRAAERAREEADRRKDEFLAVLAHELRNPLAPIRQAAQIARSPGVTGEQVEWSFDVIDRQIGHMARLLDDLMDVSRITRGILEVRRSTVELSSVVDAALEMARPLIDSRGHTLTIDVPEESLTLDADPLRLAQVIGNLLTNAAKFTARGGRIELRVRRENGEVELSISDNGVGLSAESLSAVFQMFAQVGTPLERSESGLGIGLALSKGLVDLHGGTIEAHSAGIGHGSEFIVRLPLVSAAVAEPEASAPAPSDHVNGGLKVLVADDNADAAESLAILLQLHGHDVQQAHDGKLALDKILSMQPDVALLDIGMPNLNGYEVAECVRKQSWGSRVTLVAITGWGQQEDRQRASAAGFDHHWVKPVEPDAVLALCEKKAHR